MKEINFYHLTTTTLEKALPKLMEKVYASGKRALIVTKNEARDAEIDKLLWSYTTLRFLPHGTKADGNFDEQPIFISHEAQNLNESEILVVIDSASFDEKPFNKVLYMFDGNNDAEVSKSRELWNKMKDKGFSLSYHKQDEEGKWQKAA